MPEWIVPALLVLVLGALVWIATRGRDDRPIRLLEEQLRNELGRQAQAARADLAAFQQVMLAHSGDIARTQNEQIDTFRTQLAATQSHTEAALRRFSETLAEQLRLLAEANERRLFDVRQAVDARLQALQEGNERKLDQMRATVDEKLHATLEQRLGESFKQVAERLEQIGRAHV